MTILRIIGVTALAAFFYWVVLTALFRRRISDFGRGIYRSEQPGQYWFQIGLYSLMAAGSTIYALALIGDAFDL
jgi:hypothetical protein